MPRDSIPFGLLFNSDSAERTLTGTPIATVTTAVILTYTVTDSATPTPATIALDFMMTVTKRLQTDFSFASTKVIKTIDDSSFTETATGGFDFSMVTYESSDTEVATVNTDSGEVTILTIGATTITATLAANDDYNEATAIYILTVTPIAPTFDDSANIPDQVYTVGQDVSLELPVATGGITPLKYTLERPTGDIPSGLTFNEDERPPTLTGVPNEVATVVTLTYTVTESATPAAIATLTFTVTVNKGEQTDFGFDIAILSKMIGNGPEPFTEIATGGSGSGAVTYESSDTTVATVDT